jgi:hypothetical protein
MSTSRLPTAYVLSAFEGRELSQLARLLALVLALKLRRMADGQWRVWRVHSRSTTPCRSRARAFPNPRRTNYWRPMATGWSEERRVPQSEAIQRWRPWGRSTGPRTPEGKARSARNADRGGQRQRFRHFAKILSAELRAAGRAALRGSCRPPQFGSLLRLSRSAIQPAKIAIQAPLSRCRMRPIKSGQIGNVGSKKKAPQRCGTRPMAEQSVAAVLLQQRRLGRRAR